MTSALGMHNIPLDMHNISPTCTTSPSSASPLPGTTPRQGDVVDVVHVVPKKNVPSTYLLSVIARGSFLLRVVKATNSPISTHAYPLHNMHNIPKTWHATSPSVRLARVLEDLAARRREAIARLRRAHTTSPLLARRTEPQP